MTFIETATTLSLIHSESADSRRMGFIAAGMDSTIPLKMLLDGLSDTNNDVREAAAKAFKNRYDVDEELLDELSQGNKHQRLAAAYGASSNTEISPSILDRLIQDTNVDVQAAAIRAAEGSLIPYELIYKWAENRSNAIRAAAAKACIGRDDVPRDLVDKLCFDENAEVRNVAEPLFIKYIDDSKSVFLNAIGYFGEGIFR